MHIRKYVIRVCDQDKYKDKFLGKRCDGGYLITSNIQKAIWFNNTCEADETLLDANQTIFENQVNFVVSWMSVIY